MRLNDALTLMNDVSQWTVRFFDETNGFMCPTTTNVKELYEDWYGECMMCPENGEYIYGVTLQRDNGGCYLIETGIDFDFESLMRAIESRLQEVAYGERITEDLTL